MVISAKCIFWWNKRHACHFGGGPSLNTWSSWAWINSVTSELQQPCSGYKSICYVNFKIILCNLQDLKCCQWLNYTETKDYFPCHPRKGRRYNWCCCLTVRKVFFILTWCWVHLFCQTDLVYKIICPHSYRVLPVRTQPWARRWPQGEVLWWPTPFHSLSQGPIFPFPPYNYMEISHMMETYLPPS